MPDSQPTIHSSIRELRDVLITTCDQWGIPLHTTGLAVPPQVSEAAPKADTLHALGRVNIDKARLKFERAIVAVRAVCAQFETEVVPENAAEVNFRKYGILIKEQSGLESAVQNAKRSLRACHGLIDDATTHDAEQKTQRVVKKVEAITKELGLKTYTDTGNKSGSAVTSIIVEGIIIAVDIEIESTGAVRKVNVTYASGMHQDDRVDLILAENLRSHDAPSFRRDLGILAHCDRFNGLYPTIDFFVVIRNLAADFRAIWQQEMLVCMDDFPMVLACGHGVPLLHGVHPGLSLAYWAPRAVIADVDWEELRGFLERGECKNLDQFARLWIQFEESRTPTAFLPPARAQYLLEDDEGEESVQAGEDGAHLAIITELTYPHFTTPCRFVQPPVTSPASAMLRFVAWVEPPVAVTEGIAKAIAQTVGIGGVGVGLGEVMQAERDGAAVSGTSLSLEELLIADAVPAADESQRRLSFLLKQTVQWEATFADTPVTQKYAFVGDTNTRAKVIERIPFAHPMQLFAVMQCLRQQLIFNALFQSCFNAQTYRPSSLGVQTTSLSLDDILDAAASSSTTSPVHRTIQLEIRARHPPQTLFVTFSHPSRPFALVSLEIMVPAHAPVQPSVRVTPRPREADLTLDEVKMTQVLRTCESVPVLVRWLCRKLEREGVGKVRGRDELEWGEGGEEDPYGLKRFRMDY